MKRSYPAFVAVLLCFLSGCVNASSGQALKTPPGNVHLSGDVTMAAAHR